jgi:hypothetical protein
VWLTDNGYPQTGAALVKYAAGDIGAADLQRIAAAELKSTKPATAATAKTHGTTEMDKYGSYLLTDGTNDELYSYALSSPSIPLVTQAAARLAAAGDTRTLALTQHLADLTI